MSVQKQMEQTIILCLLEALLEDKIINQSTYDKAVKKYIAKEAE